MPALRDGKMGASGDGIPAAPRAGQTPAAAAPAGREHARLLRVALERLEREVGMLATGATIFRHKSIRKNLRRAEQSIGNAIALLDLL